MRSPILLTLLAIGVTTPVLAQGTARQLVCPPSLTYCYYVERPIRPGPTSDDAYRSVEQSMECWKRQNAINSNMSAPSVNLHCERYTLPASR